MLNSDFEDGWWRKTHNGIEYDNIFVPQGWTAFWNEAAPYGRPEMKCITKVPPYLDPPRIQSGNGAVQWFTMWRTHDAGLYQQIAAVPGTRLRFSAWAHAWSSQQDDPHFSTLATEDDRRNFTFAVGIDPTGGTNPWGAAVVWGNGAHIYDTYAQIPAVEVTATGEAVTVFIRSVVLWPFKHCDAYIDTSSLEVLDVPGECRGKPREQYERTYHVWPSWATAEERRAVALYCADNQKTSGPSFDDAGLGDLDYRYAVLHYIPADRHPEFLAWFDLWYPGVEVSFADTPDEPPLFDVIAYSQRDPLWAYLKLLPSAATMGGSGCLVTATAINATLIDKAVTPGSLCLCLRENGGFTSEGGLIFAAVNHCLPYMQFGNYALWNDTANMAIVAEALGRGPTILKVDWDVSDPDVDSHFVWASDWTDDTHTDIRCIDPWTGEWTTILTAYPRGTIAQSVKGIVDYRIDSAPPPPPVTASPRPAGTRGTISLHWTPTTAAGVQNFLQTIIPPAVKVCTTGGGGPQLLQARAWSPKTLLVYRRVENGLDRYNPADAAPFVQRYIADLAGAGFNLSDFSQAPVYIESINEIYECGATANNKAAVAWDIAFMEAVEATKLNLKAVVYTAPVGNPHVTPADLEPLLPMVAKACAGKHWLGKHCYYASIADKPTFYQDSWIWYGGRFAQDDAYFVSKGYRPYWFLSEAGACGATINPDGSVSLNPAAGWKSSGNIQRYRDELVWCNNWYTAWNAANGGRLLVAALFTTGGWGWESYDLHGGDLDVVTAGLAAVL